MLLKGLYDTATDRLPIDDFKKVMFKRFYINIEEPAGCGSYTGFIKRDPLYDIYVPYLQDGKITGLMRHNCRRYSAAGVVELKRKIKELIKEDPERFKQLAQAVAENEAEYQARKREKAHPEYYERKAGDK